MTVSIIFTVLAVIVPECLAEYCSSGKYCYSNTYCCGYNLCCDDYYYDDYYSLSSTAIGGIVTSVLVIGGIVVCLLICCCNRSCYLSQRYRGQVIQPTGGTIMVQQQQQSTQVMTPPVLGYPQCAPQGYPQPPPAPGQGYQYPPPATVQGQMQTAPAPGYAGNSNQGFASDPPKYEEPKVNAPPPYNPQN